MHELKVTEQILAVALKHAAGRDVRHIVSIRLRVGELSDLEEEWLQRYFRYVAKGSIAADAQLLVEWEPVTLRCGGCGREYRFDMAGGGARSCPGCGGEQSKMVRGRGYVVSDMEVV